MRRNEKRILRTGSRRETYMSYMDVNLTNYTGVREKKADSRKAQTAAEAQRQRRKGLRRKIPGVLLIIGEI